MDKRNKFLNTYLTAYERDKFLGLYKETPTKRRQEAREFSKNILWIAADLARDGDVMMKESYINYINALGSFLQGRHPSKDWISLRNKVDS